MASQPSGAHIAAGIGGGYTTITARTAAVGPAYVAGAAGGSPSGYVDVNAAGDGLALGPRAPGLGTAGRGTGAGGASSRWWTGGLCGSAAERVCSTAAVTGAMTFVGPQSGDWTTETTYKYVGHGLGNMTVVGQEQRTSLCPLMTGLVVLGLLLAVLLFPVMPATTTVKQLMNSTGVDAKTCMFWGDPHLVTFDNLRPSFYGDGEFWIVKNPSVKIQGRYMGTKYTFGLAATQKIAIGGDFISNHIIEVEPTDQQFGGSILVDGKTICPNVPCSYAVGGAQIRYDTVGDLVDLAQSQFPRRIVHIDLPQNIKMTVYRWNNYLDLKIVMPKLARGQDGSCGNYNDIPDDDSTQAVFERLGARIEHGAMLFTRRAPIEITEQMRQMLRNNCGTELMIVAEQRCRKALPEGAAVSLINSCVFDECFGANEHALRLAKTYATAQQLTDLGM